jgi:hypothetical protein
VNFLSRGQGYTLFLSGGDAVLTLRNSSPAPHGLNPPASSEALRLQLLGANTHAAASGREELPGKANYFIGNDPSQWRTNIPTYAKVRYENVYPGVSLDYYGEREGKLEYDFIIAPGADPKAISLGVGTQEHAPLRVSPEGDLVVKIQSGEVRLHKPVVYQEQKSEVRSQESGVREENRVSTTSNRQFLDGQYVLDAQNRVHFALGPYDHSLPLVIDPVLAYATYIGGSGGDTGFAIAVDSSFDAYIAGVTNSTNFPFTGSAFQTANNGNADGFITKMNSAGTALLYSTYLGGAGNDAVTALALYSGEVLVTGYTTSSNFPLRAPAGIGTTLPYQQIYGGNTDAFISEINATGNILVYSTYLGGSGLDEGQGIAVDSSGNAYVTGFTQSANFPVTANALQSTLNGSQNVFITTMNSSGEALVYSTYLGGSEADTAQAIQIDNASPPNMYIAGYTFSSNFPTVSPVQKSLGGGSDAFVAELNGGGTALTFSTFLGGSGNDEAYGLALDGSKNIYVTGGTSSSNFPTTSGVFQPALKGAENAFVAKLNAGGTTLGYSTYLGGSTSDQGNAIAVTSAGIAYVTGLTESSDFPTQNPVQAILGLSNNSLCGLNPCPDAFITQLNATATALTYSTYLGGNGYDSGEAIALDSTGDPYITGTTISTDFPVTSPYNSASYTPPYKSTLTGTAGNAYIAKIDSANNAQISIQPGNLNFGNETISVPTTPLQVTIVNPSTAPLTISNIQITPVGLSNTVFVLTEPAEGGCLGTLAPNGATCNFNVVFTPNALGTQNTTLTITDNAGAAPGTQQTISLTGVGVTAATSVTVQPSSLSFTSQAVGTESAPQAVTVTNTGTQTLSISKFSVGTSLDFQVVTSQTGSTVPSCTAKNFTLVVNDQCSVYVYFTPTASGTRTASLGITDNASGSPQAVALTGIGTAAFTLSSPTGSGTLIGSTQTTFVIEANGPTGANAFGGAISLACSAGTTCAFTPNVIFATGQSGTTSQLVVSELTSSMSNPYPFTVTGTSGSQSYTLNMSINFQDYTLTITPSSYPAQAGNPGLYQIFINPLNGFNAQNVVLSCWNFSPPIEDSTCTFGSNPVTTNGTTPTQVSLSISTAKYSPPATHTPPRFPNGKLPPIILGLLSLAALASLAFGNRRQGRHGRLGASWFGVRVAALCLILALDLALAACRAATLTTAGTVPGNYVVTIQGQLQSNNTVNRYATTNLSVTQTNPNQ